MKLNKLDYLFNKVYMRFNTVKRINSDFGYKNVHYNFNLNKSILLKLKFKVLLV